MKKLLIVDDDDILRTVLKHYLEKQGYQIKDASSGTEALSVFTDYQPDLVVSDVAMPEMDGLEFCQELRSQPSGQLVPFIFLSGKDDLEDRIKGHSMGADDYITKPFEMKELLAKIEGQLERSRRIHAEIIRLMQHLTISNYNIKNDSNVASEGVKIIATGSILETHQPDPLPLTPAEERVFWEVIQGLTNKQISEHLFISPRTVQTHLSSILNKLNLENRSQLVRFAYEHGYQSPHASN